jgi:hypothetical protein
MKKLVFLLSVMFLTACATAQVKYNLVVQKSAPQLYLQGTGAQTRFYNTTITESSGNLVVAGGNLSLGTNNLLGTGSLGATGAGKLTKVWSIDGEFTNAITINGVPISTTYAPLVSPSFTTGITTPTLTLGSTLLSVTGNQLNYLNTATSDIQVQLGTKQATLISGTTIKTIGGTSILGSGDISIAGGGSVTSVAVTTANGVSASVANPTSAANMTFTLGAITPTSVNGVALSGSTTPTLVVSGTSAITGTNTGDNAANSLYSGLTGNATHTGDATGATALTIASGAVTLAKMANMATASLIYRKTGGAGAPEVNTLATLKVDLGLTGTNSGDQVNITGNAGTATALYTSRTINGVAFNGTANITVPSNITPGADGNVMTSNGSEWVSETPADTVTLYDYTYAKLMTENAQTTSYTLIRTDDVKFITMDAATATTITIPPYSSVTFPMGTKITIININTGDVSMVAGSGVNIRSLGGALKMSGQYAKVELLKINTNTWLLSGNIIN